MSIGDIMIAVGTTGMLASIGGLVVVTYQKRKAPALIGAIRTKPTANDPMGQKPAPVDYLNEAVRMMLQQEIEQTLRGRTGDVFNGLMDQHIAMELIARGWVAYKPSEPLKKC